MGNPVDALHGRAGQWPWAFASKYHGRSLKSTTSSCVYPYFSVLCWLHEKHEMGDGSQHFPIPGIALTMDNGGMGNGWLTFQCKNQISCISQVGWGGDLHWLVHYVIVLRKINKNLNFLINFSLKKTFTLFCVIINRKTTYFCWKCQNQQKLKGNLNFFQYYMDIILFAMKRLSTFDPINDPLTSICTSGSMKLLYSSLTFRLLYFHIM